MIQGSSYTISAGVNADVDAAVAAAAGLRLVGYSARESAGSAAVATVTIVHGATGNGGDQMLPIELAANASTGYVKVEPPVDVDNGLSLNVLAGTVDVTLFWMK